MPDDLAEPQRHDRQVVAAQLQRRRAEQDPEHGRDGDRDQTTIHQLMWMPKWGDARNAVVYAPMA